LILRCEMYLGYDKEYTTPMLWSNCPGTLDVCWVLAWPVWTLNKSSHTASLSATSPVCYIKNKLEYMYNWYQIVKVIT